MKKVVLVSLVLFLVAGSFVTAHSQTASSQAYFGSREIPSGESVAIDAILIRPVSFISIAAGLAVSVVALPFAVLSGSSSTVFRTLIEEPFAFTFARPIGDFGYHGYYGDSKQPAAGDKKE